MTILHILRTMSSPLDKVRVLKSANDYDKFVFEYAYDSEKTYGIKFNSFEIDWSTVRDCPSTMFTLLDKLASREYSGNKAAQEVSSWSKEHGDLIKLICNKDLDCGIGSGLLERAWGKSFLAKFKVQLAKEVELDKIKFPLYAQYKYDGVRAVALVSNGTITFKTRNGKSFACPAVEANIKEFCGSKDFILDGEFISGDGKLENRSNISGRVNSAIHGGVLAGSDLAFVVFDYLDYYDFKAHRCPYPYDIRYKDLTALLYPVDSTRTYSNIRLATNKTVHSKEEANTLFTEVLEAGFEGIILKSALHKYTFKRSADWIKLKAIKDAELICHRVLAGDGKYSDCIGALDCSGAVEGKQVRVNIGSGLSDSDRLKSEYTYLGKKIKIEYNSVVQDTKTGEYSLFLPRFIAVRGDL